MANLAEDTIRSFLVELGRRHRQPADLLLLGGSALCLLGSPRPTVDIDYVGDDLSKNALQQQIDQVANEMGIEVEAVPIYGFIPLPEGTNERNLLIGQFDAVRVFVLDPYTIALSKIDRGFDTDIEDIVFLVHLGLVEMSRLEVIVGDANKRANEFGLNPREIRHHLEALRERL